MGRAGPAATRRGGVMTAVRTLAALGIVLACCVAEADTIELRARPRSEVVATIAAPTLWGGLAGGAVGGAIIGYQMGFQNQSNYNWVPVLATSVGIGLASGFVYGIVDALSPHGEPAVNGPVRDGMSLRELRPRDLSGQTTMPLLAGRF
jgi:hypothetical protein